MRLDMRNPMHYDFFLNLAKIAGQEITTLLERLGKSRALKASMGLYAGGNIAAGFIVDFDEKSPTYEKYLPYPPHISVINELFLLGLKHQGSYVEVIRECRTRNIYFPLFDSQVSVKMQSRSGLRFCRPQKDQNGVQIGYEIGKGLLLSIYTNPAYIGLPIRSGKVLAPGKHPCVVDPDIFMAVYEKITDEPHKARRKTADADLHLLQGILFSECKRGGIRQVYFSSAPRIKAELHPGEQGGYRCSCAEVYPDLGGCFFVSAFVIQDPVKDHVLSQISVPDYLDDVREKLQQDYNQSKTKADSLKRERKRLMEEVNTLRANFALIRLDGPMAQMMQDDINQRLEKLKSLEEQEMRVYSANSLSLEDVELITHFLTNLRTEWDRLSKALQRRLFKLILSKVIIRPITDGNFFVDICWKTGHIQTLWIERPPISAETKGKTWSDEELETLRRLYPDASIKEILDHFPEKNWDAIRTMAHRLKIVRTIREGSTWTDEDVEILYKLGRGELTYKEARFALRHHRQADVFRHLERLGFPKPDINKLNWRVVDNTQSNESFSPR